MNDGAAEVKTEGMHRDEKKRKFACMNIIHFTKAEGAQNDFVIVDDRRGELTAEQRRSFTRLISHRRKGAGSDGAIFIDASDTHDFVMAFYNPDGSVGSMCGNGGRCAAMFAYQNGFAGEVMSFEVLGRSYSARIEGKLVTLTFPPPRTIDNENVLEAPLGETTVRFIDTGAPHLVLFAENVAKKTDFADLDVHTIAPWFRHHAMFAPEGVNVNIVRYQHELLEIRTFEKGVEDETEACGTGAIASAIAVYLRLGVPPPIRLLTHGGDMLEVGFAPDAGYDTSNPMHYAKDLYLKGPATLVFEGCYLLED